MPLALASVLPSQPAVSDVSTTPDQLKAALALAKVTSPKETPLFICAFIGCNRLFPSRERVMMHRSRDHNSEDTDHVITWNE
ncbi:hypothetical protein B0H15DRAFT_813253 [Mycena belliarum]|uniref:C2H2-type domain-containing protein n=1 Tax=Mycena belliarum TaxID=1033014 RepID=A0AAD6UFX2_9AGAR|nr:hypothetical protein B0H15DRAFT_813253 [Mycena belliae]